jgi:hypothetical protein
VACGSRTTLSGPLRRHRHYSKPFFIFVPRGREKGVSQTTRESQKVTAKMSDELKKQREQQGVILPAAKTNGGAVAPHLNAGMNYLAKHATSGVPVRFSKDGKFILPTEGDKELPEGSTFAVIWDQGRGGFQKFGEKGERPEYRVALIFSGKPPERDELPDNDPKEWPISKLSREQEDPWREVILVPLQSTEDGQVYVFSTMGVTGLKAASNLLMQSARMASKDGDSYPVIKLRRGGYEDRRFGWVNVPAFERVGKALKSDITAAVTSVRGDLDDEIPF